MDSPFFSKQNALKNSFYDFTKIKCHLIFLSKGKYTDFFNQLIKKIRSRFSYIKAKNKEFMLFFYERSPIDSSVLSLNKEPNIKFYFAFDPIEKRERYTDQYKQQLKEKNDPSLLKRSSFIFLTNNDVNEKSDMNIFFSSSKDDKLLPFIEGRIFEQLSELINFLSSKAKYQTSKKYKDDVLGEVRAACNANILLHEYNNALAIANKAIDSFSGLEEAKWKEIKACILLLKDSLVVDTVPLTKEREKEKKDVYGAIVDLFDSSLTRYKKEKQIILLIEGYLRWVIFYGSNLVPKSNELMAKTVSKCFESIGLAEPEKQFVYFLKLSDIFTIIGMKRKSNFFKFHAMLSCFNAPNMSNMVPYFLNLLSDNFKIYDPTKNIISNYEEFLKVHRIISLNQRKPIGFYLRDQETGELQETNKKKFDKTLRLEVIKHFEKIIRHMFYPTWEPIQAGIFKEIIKYYTQVSKNVTNIIEYSFSYIQTVFDSIDTEEQKSLLTSIINHSLLLQEKLILNLNKIPMIMRIIPLSCEIKFDTTSNPKKSSDDKTKIFLYNPWEKTVNTNYYWTANSFQSIKVQFYNPLSVEILLSKIRILFDGIQPSSYPTSIVLSPHSTVYIFCKIRPTGSGITNIRGIRYEIANCISEQYTNDNGNGLYYNFENISQDTLNLMNNKTETISLSNIQIYPEIPILSLKILEKVINPVIELFEYQYYTFSFLLENTGAYDINELNCYIYAYKKDNYKIALEEIKVNTLIKVNGNYIFKYKYLHKGYYKKIEFRLYYVSYEKNKRSEVEDDILIKPYLFYTKKFETLSLIKFTSQKIIPMVSSDASNEIAKIDTRIKKKYHLYFSSNKHYVSLTFENSHESAMKMIIFDTQNNNQIKEDICEGYKLKEISFLVDSSCNFSKVILKWKFVDMDDCEGQIDLSSIFPDYNNTTLQSFSFDVKVERRSDQSVCKYSIKNNSNMNKKGLKLFIYFYQIVDDDYIYNSELNENIFYTGSPSFKLDELKAGEEFSYSIDIYPVKDESLDTTCLIIDEENQSVFMCPISKCINDVKTN